MSVKQEITNLQKGFLNAYIDEATSMDKLKELFEDLIEDYEVEDIQALLTGMKLDPEFKDVVLHAFEEFEETLAIVM